MKYLFCLQQLSIMSEQEWKYPNLPPKPFLFERKVSLLDSSSPNSALNQSHIRGFFNLAVIFLAIFFITQPVVNFMEHGYWLDTTLYETVRVDYMFCVITWPLFFLWSFTSFFLQLLIMRGLPRIAALLLQHATQSGLFVYSVYVVLANDWCSTHAAFVVLQACAHFMKMHSYITVNRDLREEYEQAKKKGVPARSNYPKNVTLGDFMLYMFTPWLVYAQYPRRDRVDVVYVLKKMVAIAGLLVVMYLLYAEFIQPWVHRGSEVGIVELVLRLMLPSTVFIILGFYLVFENMCNFFAEITRLDSREFYEDWWNSYTFEEFNRKWNKPVHYFLYRHVYLQAIVRWKEGKARAQAYTFFFSACLHELLLAVIFRIVRPIFLGFIVLQVPLIKLTRWMKRNRSGHYLFWFGIMFGPSLIICFYLRADEAVTRMFAKN